MALVLLGKLEDVVCQNGGRMTSDVTEAGQSRNRLISRLSAS